MRPLGPERWVATEDRALRSAHFHRRSPSKESVSMTVPFCAPGSNANSGHSLLFVAAIFEDQPVLVDISSEIPVKHTLSSAPRRAAIDRENATEKQAAQDAKQTATVTLFTPSGEHIISGTNKGWLNIIDMATRQVQYSTRLTNNVIIYMRMTPMGRDIVVNSSDRIIRTLRLPDLTDPKVDVEDLRLEVEHKFQDLVQRLSWNHVSFSPTGEYVTASTWMNHHIYVWERSQGSLVKILEGPKEELSIVEVSTIST